MVYLCNGRLSNNWKEQTTDACNNMGESQMHQIKWKKIDSKSYMLHDSISVTTGKGKTILGTENRSVVTSSLAGGEWLTTKGHKGLGEWWKRSMSSL